MIDVNYSLRIAYTQALKDIPGVPLYYQNVPNDIAPETYIVMQSIQSTDASTNGSSDTNTSITIAIHTYEDIVNSGLNADQIAREVFNRVYPNPQAALPMDGMQMVSTVLQNDRTDTLTMQDGRNYISRYLTFGHYIFQRSDIS